MILIRRLLGDVLRRKRQDEGRTLRQLAAAARISPGYLSEIERGQKEPSSELLAAICEALEARLSDVLREVSIELAAAELAAQLESERISAPVPTARVGTGNQAPVKSMPLAKPVPRGAVRPGTRPAARPVTRRAPAAVGAVSGTQNLAVGSVPLNGVPMNSVPMAPVPAPGMAPVSAPIGAGHLAMGSPNLLAYPVVLPGAGPSSMPMNPVPQLALR
jgi:transcriptional regulator with XRE-family HTH domain